MEVVVEGDLAGLDVVLADEGAGVVDQDFPWQATEVPEGVFQALQPGRLTTAT